jgi:hypothetical protein
MVLTRDCLRASPGGRPRTVTARRGRPPADTRRRLCAGFRKRKFDVRDVSGNVGGRGVPC